MILLVLDLGKGIIIGDADFLWFLNE